jgi:hypothetical protein
VLAGHIGRLHAAKAAADVSQRLATGPHTHKKTAMLSMQRKEKARLPVTVDSQGDVTTSLNLMQAGDQGLLASGSPEVRLDPAEQQ